MTITSWCCGPNTGCQYDDTEGEPCWGAVEVVDEIWYEDESDSYFVHACTGHAGVSMGEPYKKEPT